MNEKTLIHIDRAQRIHNLNMAVDEDVTIYCNFDIVLQPLITIEIQDIVYKPLIYLKADNFEIVSLCSFEIIYNLYLVIMLKTKTNVFV